MKAVDRIFDNLEFTHKIHEKQCELMATGSIITRLVSVGLISMILLLQFIQLLPNKNSDEITVATIILTVIEVGVAFYQLSFNYDKLLDQHRSTAKSLLRIKNEMIVDMDGELDKPVLKSYVNELNKIYNDAPQTGWMAKFLVNKSWQTLFDRKK